MEQINKKLIEERFGASALSYDASAVAQKHIYERLGAMLKPLGHSYTKVLEIGCGTAGLSKYLDQRFEVESWTLNDLGRMMFEESDFFETRSGRKTAFIEGDAERVDLGQGYDLIISSSAIQWFHDPKTFIKKLYARLNDGGVLLISSFGGDNLHEIKSLINVGLNYYEKEDYRNFLTEAGYEVLLCEEESYPLYFKTALEVLRHLKATGVTALGGNEQASFWTKSKLAQFEADYTKFFSCDNGLLSLTYHPIYLLACKTDRTK